MTSDELRAAVKEAMDDALEERLKPLRDRLDRVLQQRNLALVTALVGFIAGSVGVGYAITSRIALKEEVDTNVQQLCNSAQSTALAFREPQISSKGVPEPTPHFLARMLQQREVLRGAGDLNCSELPGFARFAFLRGRALVEIEGILFGIDPHRFPKHHRQPEQTGSSPPAVSTTFGSSATSPGGSPASKTSPAPAHHGHTAPSGSGGTGGKPHSPSTEPTPEPTSPAGGGEPPAGGAGGGEEEAPSQPGGVIGNPGGALGEIVCTVNRLGITVCSE